MLGIVVYMAGDKLGEDMSQLIGRSMGYVQELSENEMEQLSNFLTQALRSVQ